MKKELKLGFFVLLVLVVAFFVLNYLRGKDIFNREIDLSARFENLEGLVESAPVYIKGYKAGKVTDISYDTESEDFIVSCSVSKQFAIPSDSRMTIYSVDIMGGKGVRIDIGTSEKSAIDGDVLSPSFEAGLMDGLASGVGPLLEKVTQTLDSLSVTVSSVNRLLSDSNQASITKTLVNLEKTISELYSISATVNGKSSELDALISNLSLFSSRLCDISQTADMAMSNVNKVVGSIEDSDIEGLISSMKNLLENINDPDGTVGSLLVDKSVYNSLDSILNDLVFLVDKIKQNPKKFLKISVF